MYIVFVWNKTGCHIVKGNIIGRFLSIDSAKECYIQNIDKFDYIAIVYKMGLFNQYECIARCKKLGVDL